MKIIDKFQQISLRTAVDLFAPMFVMEHNWSDYDKFDKLIAVKREYVQTVLFHEKTVGRLTGEIINKKATDDEGCEYSDENGNAVQVLDDIATWFDIKETFNLFFALLQKDGAATISTFTNSDIRQNSKIDGGFDVDVIDAAIHESVEAMPVPILRKKVKELSAEKVKWDRSIAASAKVGLLFYEKDLPKPATEKEFKKEFKKHFEGLPGTTITRIYKNLPISPVQYKKTGDAPTKNTDIDPIIKAAVFAGFMEGTDGDITGNALVASLRDESYEVPDEATLQKILEAMYKLK